MSIVSFLMSLPTPLKYLASFIVSMIPLIELRGGVPIGVAIHLPWYKVLPICMIGNMIPIPFIFFFARKVLEWGKDKKVIGGFFTFCLEKGEKGGKALTDKAQKLAKGSDLGLYLALLLFVGIPVPGTGAWTGTLGASILDLDFKKSIIAVICGVLLAGTIMTIVSLLGVSAFAAVK